MWQVILSMIPWETVLPWFVAKVTGLSKQAANAMIERAFKLVEKAEKEYGSGKGPQKFAAVKKEMKRAFGDFSEWMINLVVELAVGVAKKKGVIK